MAIKVGKIRSRLRRLHKKIDEFDYQSPDRDLNIQSLEEKMALLCRHISRMTGTFDITIEQMSEKAIKEIRQIKNKMKQHKRIQATLSSKTVGSEPEDEAKDSQTEKIFHGKAPPGKRKWSTSFSQVSQDTPGGKDDGTHVDNDEDQDRDSCVVTDILRYSNEGQEVIKAAMVQRDQWL